MVNETTDFEKIRPHLQELINMVQPKEFMDLLEQKGTVFGRLQGVQERIHRLCINDGSVEAARELFQHLRKKRNGWFECLLKHLEDIGGSDMIEKLDGTWLQNRRAEGSSDSNRPSNQGDTASTSHQGHRAEEVEEETGACGGPRIVNIYNSQNVQVGINPRVQLSQIEGERCENPEESVEFEVSESSSIDDALDRKSDEFPQRGQGQDSVLNSGQGQSFIQGQHQVSEEQGHVRDQGDCLANNEDEVSDHRRHTVQCQLSTPVQETGSGENLGDDQSSPESCVESLDTSTNQCDSVTWSCEDTSMVKNRGTQETSNCVVNEYPEDLQLSERDEDQHPSPQDPRPLLGRVDPQQHATSSEPTESGIRMARQQAETEPKQIIDQEEVEPELPASLQQHLQNRGRRLRQPHGLLESGPNKMTHSSKKPLLKPNDLSQSRLCSPETPASSYYHNIHGSHSERSDPNVNKHSQPDKHDKTRLLPNFYEMFSHSSEQSSVEYSSVQDENDSDGPLHIDAVQVVESPSELSDAVHRQATDTSDTSETAASGSDTQTGGHQTTRQTGETASKMLVSAAWKSLLVFWNKDPL